MTEAVLSFINSAKQADPAIKWDYYSNACVVSKLMPLHDAKGWCLGRCYYDVTTGGIAPLTRISTYHADRATVDKLLEDLEEQEAIEDMRRDIH